jgi:hypothetical protein
MRSGKDAPGDQHPDDDCPVPSLWYRVPAEEGVPESLDDGSTDWGVAPE